MPRPPTTQLVDDAGSEMIWSITGKDRSASDHIRGPNCGSQLIAGKDTLNPESTTHFVLGDDTFCLQHTSESPHGPHQCGEPGSPERERHIH